MSENHTNGHGMRRPRQEAGNNDYDDEFDAYDRIPMHMPTPMPLAGQSLTYNQLMEGAEFEVKDDSSAREREELEQLHEENQLWWDKEELLKMLDDKDSTPYADDDIVIGEDQTLFEAMMDKMQVIYRKKETDEPLVYKQVLRPGRGEIITMNCAAKYHVTAYIEGQDEPFDCSRIRNKPHFHKLNQDPIVKGLLIGMISMYRGEKSRFLVKPEMAFGRLGCPPRIPGDASILYVVEIIKTFEESTLPTFEMMSFEERQSTPFLQILKMCDDERKSGNTYFTDKRYKEARVRYNRAIQILEDRMVANGAEEAQAKQILLKLYCNSANVLNELRKHHAAISFCKRALNIDPKSTKALYHYGKAALHNGEYGNAKKYLLNAAKLKPHDTLIANLLTKLEQRIQEDDVVADDLYKKMGSCFK